LIVRRPQALADLLEQADYIARDDPEAAHRLLDSVERTIARIARYPRIGRRVPFEDRRLRDLRMLGVEGFPSHIVFYRVIEGGIEVTRLLHAARDLPRALTPSSARSLACAAAH
jgi:toxin ParE1/3/4